MSVSEKAYRCLLRAYPRRFHDRYAPSMEQLFRDRLRESSTLLSLTMLWVRTLADWVVPVPARYWEQYPHRHHPTLTQPAMRCLFFARAEASSFSRQEITVEHLLLGLLREEPSLLSGSAALDSVLRAIEAAEPARRRVPPMETLRVSDQARQVIRAANEMAHADGRQQGSPADLAAAISREAGGSLAARLLREHGKPRT